MAAATHDSPAPAAISKPFTQTREFWEVMIYAVILGVFGAVVSLAFLGIIGVGNNWYTDSNPDWFGGHWWWVAITAAAGVGVGLVRLLTHLPEKTSGLIADLRQESVNPREVPGIVAVSLVSLIGGASLGPEKALGAMGGGAGTWISKRRGLSKEDAQVNTLSGFGGAYGGLFSSTVIIVMFILEIARPGGARLTKALVGAIVASSVSFGIYFAIAGSVFLDLYQVPAFTYNGWQLLIGVGLGLFAAVLVTLLVVLVKVCSQVFDRIKLPGIAKCTLGGIVFGVVGVALPLTMFTGSDQLGTALTDASTLSLGLVLACVIGKMFAFAVCEASGFIGGPIFPALFIGGTAGIAVHHVISGVPLGLAFACMLAAVPGAVVAAPFSTVLLAAFLTQVGALQTAPILISVVTAYLAMEAVKYLVASRQNPA